MVFGYKPLSHWKIKSISDASDMEKESCLDEEAHLPTSRIVIQGLASTVRSERGPEPQTTHFYTHQGLLPAPQHRVQEVLIRTKANPSGSPPQAPYGLGSLVFGWSRGKEEERGWGSLPLAQVSAHLPCRLF